MIHAYGDFLLDNAMENLGSAVEYAVLACDVSGQEFLDMFISGGIASEFAKGNVKYILGMSGIELACKVFERVGFRHSEKRELIYIDYSAEYWVGWTLAYYQWYTDRSFSNILRDISYDTMFRLYKVLHEADPSKSVAVFDRITAQKKESNLAKFRKLREMSQTQLSKESGVSLRSIQSYEQKRSNINNAQYNHLKALSKVLRCNIEDLVD